MTECRVPLAPISVRRPESLVIEGEILIDGPIEAGGRICVAAFRRALNELVKSERIVLRFAAGAGGYGEEARRIYCALRDCLKPITAHVERAASADTLLVMAAQEVTIVQGGGFLVHPPRANVHGQLTASELRQQANCLDEFQEALLDAYQRRTGMPRQELRELMARDVWMTAERAVELRFCDRVVPRPRAEDECPALHCARARMSASPS